MSIDFGVEFSDEADESGETIRQKEILKELHPEATVRDKEQSEPPEVLSEAPSRRRYTLFRVIADEEEHAARRQAELKARLKAAVEEAIERVLTNKAPPA